MTAGVDRQERAMNQIPMLLRSYPQLLSSIRRAIGFGGEFLARLLVTAERGNLKLILQSKKI
jgi:hypothetical protein